MTRKRRGPRRGFATFDLATDYFTDPEWGGLSLRAFKLMHVAIAWCNQHRSNGFLPGLRGIAGEAKMHLRQARSAAAELVESNGPGSPGFFLVVHAEECTCTDGLPLELSPPPAIPEDVARDLQDGFTPRSPGLRSAITQGVTPGTRCQLLLRNFLNHNPSREEVASYFEAKSTAGSAGNRSRWGSQVRPTRDTDNVAGATPEPIAPVIAKRSPSTSTSTSATTDDEESSGLSSGRPRPKPPGPSRRRSVSLDPKIRLEFERLRGNLPYPAQASRLKDIADKHGVDRVLQHLPGWAESGSKKFDVLERSITERWGEDQDPRKEGGDSPMMSLEEMRRSKLGQANGMAPTSEPGDPDDASDEK